MSAIKVVLITAFGIIGYWIILFLWFWLEDKEKEWYKRKYGGG